MREGVGEGAGARARRWQHGKAQEEFQVVNQRNLAMGHPSRLIQQPLHASWKAVHLQVTSDTARTYSHS